MGLKQSGSPGRIAQELARARSWRRSGALVKPESTSESRLTRVTVQQGSFVTVGAAHSAAAAVEDARERMRELRRRYLTSVPPTLPAEHRARLDVACGRRLPLLRPRLDEVHAAERVFQRLRSAFRAQEPPLELHHFGSLVSGLAMSGADLDVCVLQPQRRPVDAPQRELHRAMKLLRRMGDFQKLLPLPHARVPIIKFVHGPSGVSGDLGFGAGDGAVNSLLLRAYVESEPRVRDLVLLVKHWAKRRGVADASIGFISSYAWTLLALFYLQHRTVAAVIDPEPAMNKLSHGRLTSAQKSGFDWLLGEFMSGTKRAAAGERSASPEGASGANGAPTSAATAQPAEAADKASLGELLDGFFSFLVHRLKPGSEIVCPRDGTLQPLDARSCASSQHRSFLYIEDPLDVRVNVGRHVRENTVARFFAEIRRAHAVLRRSGSLKELCERVDVL